MVLQETRGIFKNQSYHFKLCFLKENTFNVVLNIFWCFFPCPSYIFHDGLLVRKHCLYFIFFTLLSFTFITVIYIIIHYVCLSVCFTFSRKLLIRSSLNFTWAFLIIGRRNLNKMRSVAFCGSLFTGESASSRVFKVLPYRAKFSSGETIRQATCSSPKK